MKNTLWFFFPPADEREVLIYKKAYERALSVLVLCVGIMLYAGWFIIMLFGRNWGQEQFFVATANYLGGSLLLTYLAGWSAVRKEELSLTMPPRKPVKSWIFIAIVAALILVAVAIFLFNLASGLMPQLSLAEMAILLIAGTHMALVAWAWNMSAGIPTAVRLVLCLLFSPAMIVLGFWKKKNLATFVGAYAVAVVVEIVIALMLVIPLRMFVFEPMYLSTDSLAPVFNKGDYVLVSKLWNNNLVINDRVVYFDEQHQRKVGLVMGVDPLSITVGDNTHTGTVSRNDIIGKIVPIQ